MDRHFESDGIIFDRIGGSGFHFGDGIVFPEAEALGIDAKFRFSIQRFRVYRFMILCISIYRFTSCQGLIAFTL